MNKELATMYFQVGERCYIVGVLNTKNGLSLLPLSHTPSQSLRFYTKKCPLTDATPVLCGLTT